MTLAEADSNAGLTGGPPGTAGTATGPAALAVGGRTVVLGLVVAVAQTVALGVAAVVTGSAAMKTQTATNLADVAVGVFLLIGVVSGSRAPDEKHPLGYGRERFFWSFVAAVGIFVGGVGAAGAETLQTALHPRQAGSYLPGYAVLVVVILLDLVSLTAGLKPLRARARSRGRPLTAYLWHGTDPAVTTVVLSSAVGLAGGVVAIAGLAGRQLTGSTAPDVIASGIIGLLLLAASVGLLHTNRELLTGRGISPADLAAMREVVESLAGVVAVPDLFAVVVGPASLIVDADIVFDDLLSVPEIENLIVAAAAALRAGWPAVNYVYLNPVAAARSRRARKNHR